MVVAVFRGDIDVETFQVFVEQFAHHRVLGLERILDGVAQLVFLDQHRVGCQPGVKLDLVQALVIGRVGDGEEKAFAAAVQRQRIVCANQLFIDQVGRQKLRIDDFEVEQGYAVLGRRGLGDLHRTGQPLGNQVADQRLFGFGDVFDCLGSNFLIEYTVVDQTSGKTAQSQCGIDGRHELIRYLK